MGRIIDISDTKTLFNYLNKTYLPGDTYLVAPGTYDTTGLNVKAMLGTLAEPITVKAADVNNPPLFTAGDTSNAWYMTSCSNFCLDTLNFFSSGQNCVNIDDALNGIGSCNNVTVQNCQLLSSLHSSAGNWNHDGLKATGINGLYFGKNIITNYDTGGQSFDLVGCSYGIIEDNYSHDPYMGGDPGQANAMETKGNCFNIKIRRNRFVNCITGPFLGGVTSERYFRPAYAGTEAKNIIFEGNFISGCTGYAATFFGSQNCKFRYNTVLAPESFVAFICFDCSSQNLGFTPPLIHTQNCEVTDNVFYWDTDPSKSSMYVHNNGLVDPLSMVIRNNAWMKKSGTPVVTGLPVPEVSPIYGNDNLQDPSNW